ncbi:hypothetical protein [Sphaerisporangium aureirubrum]|uniref:Uncharacterized protein n=1 Tax=Sphaerisporangium aureirubrum TaxID=1544736 RepID=A0ABW1NJG8_9ACTN
MNELLEQVVAAYGGLDRWEKLTSVRARVRAGGLLWPMKRQMGVLDDVITRIDPHRQFTTTEPFGEPGLRGSFTPDRVAVETDAGEMVEERFHPRAAYAGHRLDTPWDRLHVAYFNGYAMWTYLTEPFSLAGPGFEVTELEPWQEDGETWRRLRVVFPGDVDTHSKENVYYVDAGLRIRRHDYVAEVAGTDATGAAHYASDFQESGGFLVPARRRVHPVGPGGRPMLDTVLVSIDLSDIRFE